MSYSSYAGLGLDKAAISRIASQSSAAMAIRPQVQAQFTQPSIPPQPGVPPQPGLAPPEVPSIDNMIDEPIAPDSLFQPVDPATLIQPTTTEEIPWLWIGLGIGAVAVAGGGYWYWKKKRGTTPNRRRRARRSRR